jgi:hypothetical protein
VGLASSRIEAVERRFVLVREQLRQSRESPGSRPIDVPGDTSRVFVTDCSGPDEVIWRDHNRRAGMEDRIPELRRDPSAHGFCMKEFFAPEAAFRPVLLRFNLLAEFQRAVGLLDHRAGDDPHPGADLRCHPRSCRPSSGCQQVQSWDGLNTGVHLSDRILNWQIPNSPNLDSVFATRPRRRARRSFKARRKQVAYRSTSEFRIIGRCWAGIWPRKEPEAEKCLGKCTEWDQLTGRARPKGHHHLSHTVLVPRNRKIVLAANALGGILLFTQDAQMGIPAKRWVPPTATASGVRVSPIIPRSAPTSMGSTSPRTKSVLRSALSRCDHLGHLQGVPGLRRYLAFGVSVRYFVLCH